MSEGSVTVRWEEGSWRAVMVDEDGDEEESVQFSSVSGLPWKIFMCAIFFEVKRSLRRRRRFLMVGRY